MKPLAIWMVVTALCAAQSMFRADAAHSGVYAGAGPRQFHQVKWRFATGDRVVSSPVWSDGVLFFGSDDGNVYAVDAASGRQVWQFVTGGPVPSTPAVAGGVVYINSYDGKFYAIDAKAGRLKWKFRTGGERRFEAKGLNGFQPKNQTVADPWDVYLSSPVVANDSVYFGSGDQNVYALNAANGDLRWKFATGDVVHASPALANGIVYVGSWDSYFYAIDAATGQLKWKFHGGEDPLVHNQVGFQSSPSVVDGVVYTGCRDSNVYALDAATGQLKWKVFNDGSWVNATPAVVNGKVVFVTSDTSLFRTVDVADGKPAQKESIVAYAFGSPAIAAGVAYYGVLNGTFEARELETGKLLWNFQTETARRNGDWILSSDRKFNGAWLYRSPWREAPIVANDLQFRIGAFFSSPLVKDGVVYVGSADGYLYALE